MARGAVSMNKTTLSFSVLCAVVLIWIIGCQVFDEPGIKNLTMPIHESGDDETPQGRRLHVDSLVSEIKETLSSQSTQSGESSEDYFLQISSDLMAGLFYNEVSLKQAAEVFRDTGLRPYSETYHSIQRIQTLKTRRNWPGVRYFMIEYIGDEEGSDIHSLSFEFQPGEGSKEKVLRSLEQSFGSLSEPVPDRVGIEEWRLPDGFRLAIYTLTKQDIDDGHIDKVRSPSDLGAVVVTLYKPMH